jgi:predicted Zn-dependent protease
MLLSEKDARAVCHKLLTQVTAADAEVSVASSDQAHLRFAANAFATSGRREDVNVSVTVWVDKKKGTATTNEVDDASLQALVREAEQIAAVSPVDREYLPTLGPQEYRPVEAYAEATANVPVAARAKAVNDIIAACEKGGVSGAGFHQAEGSAAARATKNGGFFYHRSSQVGLSVTARTADGTGSGYFSRDHYDLGKLDTARIARESIGKALRSREPKTLDPGAYTVILEPQAVADLLGFMRFLFDARSADEGRSPFAAAGGKTRLGEKVFDERLNVYTDPWHPEIPGAPFTQGGLPARKFHLVKSGVVETLIYSRFWAQQKGKEPTPGPVNGVVEGSGAPVSVDDMVKDTRNGLLVSRFWYLRPVDPRTALITGLTRDGVWYVEDGKVSHPVRNFRFNQGLLQMLAPGNLDAIGAPERVTGGEGGGAVMMPALKVKEFRFTSQSEAV